MHQIKKYANRKLYNVTTKRYINMEEIARLVQSGEDVTIIDNASGKDITREIVSQLVGRVFNGQARKLPLAVLTQLMRKGSGGLVDYTRKYVSFWQNALNFAEDELDKVNAMIGRETSLKKENGQPTGENIPPDPREMLNWLNERIDRRLQHQLQAQEAAVKKQITKLKSDITGLTARIESFENIFSQMLQTGATAAAKPSAAPEKPKQKK